MASPLVNTQGKKEEVHCSMTTVKSSEMELKWCIRLGLGQGRGLREGEEEGKSVSQKIGVNRFWRATVIVFSLCNASRKTISNSTLYPPLSPSPPLSLRPLPVSPPLLFSLPLSPPLSGPPWGCVVLLYSLYFIMYGAVWIQIQSSQFCLDLFCYAT